MMMGQVSAHKARHQPHSRIRRIAGWLTLLLGIAMLILPGPGFLGIALGVILIGRHDPLLRRWAIVIRVGLRRLSRAENPVLHRVGGWLWEWHRQGRLFVRDQLQRHARGEGINPVLRIWLVVTLLVALVGLTISLWMLLS
jgi:hypothetical protein